MVFESKTTQLKDIRLTRSLPYQIKFCSQCHLKFMYVSVILFSPPKPKIRKIITVIIIIIIIIKYYKFLHHRKHKASLLQRSTRYCCYKNNLCLSKDAKGLNPLCRKNKVFSNIKVGGEFTLFHLSAQPSVE